MEWQTEHIVVSSADIKAAGDAGLNVGNSFAVVQHFFREKLKIELPLTAQIKTEKDTLSDGFILYARWMPEPELPKPHDYEGHGNGD